MTADELFKKLAVGADRFVEFANSFSTHLSEILTEHHAAIVNDDDLLSFSTDKANLDDWCYEGIEVDFFRAKIKNGLQIPYVVKGVSVYDPHDNVTFIANIEYTCSVNPATRSFELVSGRSRTESVRRTNQFFKAFELCVWTLLELEISQANYSFYDIVIGETEQRGPAWQTPYLIEINPDRTCNLNGIVQICFDSKVIKLPEFDYIEPVPATKPAPEPTPEEEPTQEPAPLNSYDDVVTWAELGGSVP
jgi:hypothetical protein